MAVVGNNVDEVFRSGVYEVIVFRHTSEKHGEFSKVLRTALKELIESADDKTLESSARRVATFKRCGVLFNMFTSKTVVHKEALFKIPMKDMACMLTELDPYMARHDKGDLNSYFRHMSHAPVNDPPEYSKINIFCYSKGLMLFDSIMLKDQVDYKESNDNNNNNNMKQ